jgi:uncharacterized YigZ family protein
MNPYRTICLESEGLFKEKGSKFIAYAYPCFLDSEVKERINVLKKTHPHARHFCYAYKFGFKGETYRANDDGEPNNSAGTPILGQIQSFELTNILIVVVRYFGGTKLGVSGLVNAYKLAAKDAIENNTIITKEVSKYVKLESNYIDYPELMSFVKKNKLQVLSNLQNETCLIEVLLPLDRELHLLDFLSSYTIIEQKLI